MHNRIVVVAAAALVVGGLDACSLKPQSAISSTASVTVNGYDTNFRVIKCSQLEWYRTIDIGGDFAGAKVVIDQRAQPLTAESVHIQNLRGFTGMYSAHDGNGAVTNLSGDRFTITGTATGYKSDQPTEPATATFKIVATC
ncbi:lipoprotein LpqH [Mycobacterium paraffinicum]|nr:lipoprotein LpqH [Mycobacterium paraffinicum]MCV7310602.1 lipoprotein LpqH [Mycobacterium paraffinicum]